MDQPASTLHTKPLAAIVLSGLALVVIGMALYWHRRRVLDFLSSCRQYARHATKPTMKYRAFLDDSHVVDEWLCWVCYHKNQHQNSTCAMCRYEFDPASYSANLSPTALHRRSQESTISASQQRIRNRHLWKRAPVSPNSSACMMVHWVHTPVLDISNLLQGKLPDGAALSIVLDGPYNEATSALMDTPAQDSPVAYLRVVQHDTSTWVRADTVRWPSSIYTDADVSWDIIQAVATEPFSAKLSWFHQLLHAGSRDHATGYSLVSVHRDEVVDSSMKQLLAIPPSSMRQRLKVEFHNEPGVDAGGGVLREWFGLVSRCLFSQWFQPTHTPDVAYWFKAGTSIPRDQSPEMFVFAGRVVAKAIQEGQCLSVHLAIPLWKHVLGMPMTWHDLVHVDADLHQSIAWMLTHDNPLEDLALDFTMHGVPLMAGGADVAVTDANKFEYVDKLVGYLLFEAVHTSLEAFLQGFYDVLSPPVLHAFDAFEMDLVLCGHDDINATDWHVHTTVEYLKATPASSLPILRRPKRDHHHQQQDVIDWFWRIVHSFSQVQKAKLLQFVTGSSRPPIEGFRALTSSNGQVCPFTIALSAATSKFPVAMTCFNRIYLPLYKSQAEMQEYLTMVTEMDVTGFTMP
ncbi:hypothetical protein H257_09552 [Aphanomyces astaci]|uniref:HECT-type E3 ubiquitin transferase n=1 Tax=Aphanomyces astaci TaxID=112090 RepID=W4GA75_APHAT|nr:hypothetical protein H257_09552 [Aphanomyces astaci]ETV76550.1 hypothetical protein H257_09552 [Aphanomyces astaci]|eukprot:XP_009834095.1 hypothetical protein H257_09552 [Aphanomyces astaci]